MLSNTDNSLTWFNTLNYNRKFGVHSFNLLVGTEAVTTYGVGFLASRSSFAFDDLDYRYLDIEVRLKTEQIINET